MGSAAIFLTPHYSPVLCVCARARTRTRACARGHAHLHTTEEYGLEIRSIVPQYCVQVEEKDKKKQNENSTALSHKGTCKMSGLESS